MRFPVTLSAVVALSLMALAGCNSNDKGARNPAAATTTTTTAPTRGADPTAPFSATPQQSQAPTVPGDGVRRITAAELNESLKKGEAIVVDVRNSAAFKQNRIKGAILIPFNEVAEHLNELPRDKMIVTYCA